MPRAKTLRGSIREHVPTVDNADTTDALVAQGVAWYTNRETARVVDRKGARTARRNAEPVHTGHAARNRFGTPMPASERVKKVVVPLTGGEDLIRAKVMAREARRIRAEADFDAEVSRTQVFVHGVRVADVTTDDADRFRANRAHQAARNMAAKRRAGIITRGGK